MFFHYWQNNSGGEFQVNDKVCQHVVVEADDPRHANDRARDIGLYFDGVSRHIDCECCGDRWRRQWIEEAGDVGPMINGLLVEDHTDTIFGEVGEVYCRVYYLDGKVEEFVQKEKVLTLF